MRSILVDPVAQSVEIFDVDPGQHFADVRQAIGAEHLSVVVLGRFFGRRGVEQLLIDDEGLLSHRGPQAFTLVKNQPIAGRFVIVCEAPDMLADGDDEDDDHAAGHLHRTYLLDVDFGPQDVRDRLKFVTPAFAKASIDLQMARARAHFEAEGIAYTELRPDWRKE